jgi:hypothetical protein
MKGIMHTTTKRSIKSLTLASILILSLSGCVADNPFIVEKEQAKVEQEKSNVEAEQVVYRLENLGMLRYSTTGYMNFKGLKYNLEDTTGNPTFEETGISIEVNRNTQDNSIDSIDVTYLKGKGIPKIELLPFSDTESEVTNRESEKYITVTQSIRDPSDRVDVISFIIEPSVFLTDDINASLEEAIAAKSGTPSYAFNNIELNERGDITINGPVVQGMTDANSYTYTGKPDGKKLLYVYPDADTNLKLIEITLAEEPYYDIDQQKLIINWNISEPTDFLL